MSYIILAAGKGTNLRPLTLNYPKTSYQLDASTTVLQRMVKGIRRYDRDAEIVVVVGYLADAIKEELKSLNVTFISNPFYEVTNSIASLWFARDYLDSENATIIHGDVVLGDDLLEQCLTEPTNHPYILVDSSSAAENTYNVVTRDDAVLVMSKQLTNFTSRYACVTKLDAVSARLLKQEISAMVNAGMIDQYFEDALVQMIMFKNFELQAKDIKDFAWSEINSVDDLLAAQRIQADSTL